MFSLPIEEPEQIPNDNPRITKGNHDILPVPCERDNNEIVYRVGFKQSNINSNLKQFCYPTKEKHHYGCLVNLPVFYVKSYRKKNKNKYGHKLKAMGTLNGLVVDPMIINDERDLLRHITWYGFGHSENKDHTNQKYLGNRNDMFAAAVYGKPTITNHIFSWPVRDKLTGLLHKRSCMKKHAKFGKNYTTSVFPFNFSVFEKLQKAKADVSKYEEYFGDTYDNLIKAGWILNPSAYDPQTEKYFEYWYGERMPPSINKNGRLIPIYHEVCDNEDMFETEHDNFKALHINLAEILQMYDEVRDPQLLQPITQGDTIRQKRTKMKKYEEIGKKLVDDGKNKIELKRIFHRLNPTLKHFKCLGDPNSKFNVQHGGPMDTHLTMDTTT